MSTEEAFERHIQALLDGQPLADAQALATGALEPVRVVSAIAALHRVALFGSDAPVDLHRTTWGHLEIRSEIGRGASGTVYRAWDSRLTREVALKLFEADTDPAIALAEGRLLARLRHPNIVQVFGADTHNGTTGVWMELLDGLTLDELLASEGTFSSTEVLLTGIDLAAALSAVHSAGLLHRDIKGRNVLRERGGRIVLMDLGAGRAIEQVPAHGDTTGTPLYMAPEVLAGDPASPRSDIYGVGVLLFRLLTGEYPFQAVTIAELRTAHAGRRQLSLSALRPDIGASVRQIVERCTALEPDARPAAAAALEAEFTDALGATLAERPRVRTRFERTIARHRRRLLTVAAILSVVVVGGWSTWDTVGVRAARRAGGLAVPPLSALYLTTPGGLGIVRNGALMLRPFGFGPGAVLTVSEDLGIRVMHGMPPWFPSRAFTLDAMPTTSVPTRLPGLCCFYDGTTDGQFNYAPRTDSTLLEPLGSRPLAPAALYRFKRDWSAPERMFLLSNITATAAGVYSGVAYSDRTRAFFLLRAEGADTFLERWTADGTLQATVKLPSLLLGGLAIDPRDGTLWSNDSTELTDFHLENLDLDGRRLGSFRIAGSWTNPLSFWSSLEFAWPRNP